MRAELGPRTLLRLIVSTERRAKDVQSVRWPLTRRKQDASKLVIVSYITKSIRSAPETTSKPRRDSLAEGQTPPSRASHSCQLNATNASSITHGTTSTLLWRDTLALTEL